jgi:hypothetical protein
MHDTAVTCSGRFTSFALATALLIAVGWLAPSTAAADEQAAGTAQEHFDPLRPCAHCMVLLGVGTTFEFWGWTNGIVLPVTLELSDSRWELGAFRMARRQTALGYPSPNDTAAEPYWGFSAMRRWQILHRSWSRWYLGAGGSYKTETDYYNSTRWNFAYLIALRFDLGSSHSVLEIATRHWSNANIKLPNRGQNFLTVSVSF